MLSQISTFKYQKHPQRRIRSVYYRTLHNVIGCKKQFFGILNCEKYFHWLQMLTFLYELTTNQVSTAHGLVAAYIKKILLFSVSIF